MSNARLDDLTPAPLPQIAGSGTGLSGARLGPRCGAPARASIGLRSGRYASVLGEHLAEYIAGAGASRDAQIQDGLVAAITVLVVVRGLGEPHVVRRVDAGTEPGHELVLCGHDRRFVVLVRVVRVRREDD